MKKFVILMILILIQQTALSQQVVIDTTKKTITLSREKKIDVAKIIENEKTLFEENRLLKEANSKLELINESLASDLKIVRDEISAKKDDLINLQRNIIKDRDSISESSKNKNYGFYFQSSFTTGDFGGASLGLSFIKEKMLFGLSFNPKNKNTLNNSFTVNLGLKLF